MPTSKKLDSKKAARLRKLAMEQEKRRLRRAERRRTWLFSGAATLVGGAIVAAVVVQQALKQPPIARRSISSFGVSLADAGCGPVQSPPSGGDRQLAVSARTTPSYASVPPVSGSYAADPLPFTPHYYGPTATVRVERALANERNGTTVLWYDRSASQDQLQVLRDLATRVPSTQQEFLVAPWNPSYGALPSGKHFALATWGHRRLCAGLSGAAVAQFIQRFPATAAPPPSAAPSPTAASSPSSAASRSSAASPSSATSPS